jgi:cytochrome c-type biogenesis protein CcmH
VIRRIAAIALVLLAALPALGSALTVTEVAREVRCPTCNTPLDVSNAPVADDMKAYIAAHIEQGESKQQIIDGLVDEFGTGILATPPKSGFDLIAWIAPALVVALGLAAIPIMTRAWARRARTAAPEVPAPSPEEARRLDEELRRRE